MGEVLLDAAGRVYRFALRLAGDHHVAEDIAQETLLRAWRHQSRLRDPHAARGWLFRIAANLWRDQARRARLPVGRAGSLGEDLDAGDPPPERALADRDEVLWVTRALDGLPARQRQVLYLHAFEDLSAREIARVLGIRTNAVKSSLSLARRTLRGMLRDVSSRG